MSSLHRAMRLFAHLIDAGSGKAGHHHEEQIEPIQNSFDE